MIRTQIVPIWLVFAFQFQLNIHSIFKLEMNIGHRDLFKAGIRASITLRQFSQFDFISPTLHFGDLGGNELLRNIKDHIGIWIKTDFMAPVRNMFLIGMGRKPNSVNAFSLLRQHPILCGSLVIRLNLLMQNRGIALANTKGSIRAVAHLYNAVQHSISDMPKWADMEALIKYFREEKVFKGARPTSPKDFFKRYAIMLGSSATAFASNRRSSRPDLAGSGKNTRGMFLNRPFTQLFWDRLLSGESAKGISTLASVEKLFNETNKGM
jgi:hypothetical protein